MGWIRDNKGRFAKGCLNNKGYDDDHEDRLEQKQEARDKLMDKAFEQEDVKQRKNGKTKEEYKKEDKELTDKGRNVCRKKELKEKKMEEMKKKKDEAVALKAKQMTETQQR